MRPRNADEGGGGMAVRRRINEVMTVGGMMRRARRPNICLSLEGGRRRDYGTYAVRGAEVLRLSHPDDTKDHAKKSRGRENG